MIIKKMWIKCVAAVAFCLTAASCTKTQGSEEQHQDYVQDFKALVMGGKEIDPTQDWSTVGSVPVKINVDFDNEMVYRVYILQAPPILTSDAAYIGMALVKSGSSKTISIAKPANCGLLYAACYDNDGHAMCQPFPVKESGTEITFNGKSPNITSPYVSSEGNAWSVPTYELPDLTAYTTGNLIEASSLEFKEIGDEEIRIKVSSYYAGFVPCLGLTRNKSIYVTNTWELSFNQQVAYGNVVVVGEGGNLMIPKNFTLSTAPSNEEANGLIYVLPGGKITGEGTVDFVTANGTYCYNAGTITAKTIYLNGGTLYNAGIIGNTDSPVSSLTSTEELTDKNLLVNASNGSIGLKDISGELLSIENAGYLKTSGNLTLNNTTKTDDGSYIECASLTLEGKSDGSKILYMGNAAYVNCLGNISINNFGVWGPSGDNFKADAILKVNGCSACTTTDGVKGTYLLDHVELVLPSDFPTIFDKNAINKWGGSKIGVGIGTLQTSFSGYNSLRMLYYWFNGYEGKLLNADNYVWSIEDKKSNFVWNSAIPSSASGIGIGNQTCTYSTSASYNYPNFTKTNHNLPKAGGIFYAFETPQNSLKDFDYNDVVLFVNTPTDEGNGYSSLVQVMAVGNTMKTLMLYNGEPFGNEVHMAAGSVTDATVNTTSITRSFRGLERIQLDEKARIDQLPFTVMLEDAKGNITTYQPSKDLGDAPLYLVINGDINGKWFWPSEGINIGIAYPQFSNWASDVQTYIDWYDKSNASNRVISY